MTPPPNPRHHHHLCYRPESPWDAGLEYLPVSPDFLHLSFSSRPPSLSGRELSYTDALDVADAMMTPDATHKLPLRKVKWNDIRAWAISGDDVVQWLLSNGFASSRSGAADIARHLVRLGALIPTFKVESSATAFKSSPGHEYVHRGLSCMAERGLNAAAVYPGKARDALVVLKELNQAFAKVIHRAVFIDGHFVDYAVIRGSAAWREVLVLLTELAVCTDDDIAIVDDDVKKASLFNLYNVLIFHAKLVFGHPTDLVKRSKFFNDAAYVVARKRITSVELEHDILRRKLDDADPRAPWKLSRKDPRMHFILNCGAQSCPPLVAMKEDMTEEILQQATTKFIEKNCDVDTDSKRVTLSRLWKWFRSDFTPESSNDADLLQWIANRASKDKSAKLAELMKLDYKVKFDVYNWADNGDDNAKPDVRFMFIYDRSFEKNA